MTKINKIIVPILIILIGYILAISYKNQQLAHLGSDIHEYGIINIWLTVLAMILIYSFQIKILNRNKSLIIFLILQIFISIVMLCIFKSNFIDITKILFILNIWRFLTINRINKYNLYNILIIIVINLILLKSLTPLGYESVFITLTGRLDAIQPLVNTYLNNTLFGELFINFNQRTSFGGEVYYPLSQSELFQLFLIYFYNDNTYLIAYEGFKLYLFLLFNIACIGIYYLAIDEFNFKGLSAILAGLLYIYGNYAFLGYLGNENYHHLSEYILMPYTLILFMKGIRLNKDIYIYIGGLILGLSTLVMRSAIEYRVLSVIFAIVYFILISSLYYEQKNIRKIIKCIFIIVIGYISGSIIDITTILGNIYLENINVIQPHKFYGFPWKNSLVEWWSLFFEYESSKMYPSPPDDVGKHVGFYRGPGLVLIIIYFQLFLIFKLTNELNHCKRTILIFTLVTLILMLVIQLGSDSYISIIMNKLQFGRIHFSSRYITFYNLLLIFPLIYFFDKIYLNNYLNKKIIIYSCIIYTVVIVCANFLGIPLVNFYLQMIFVILFTFFLLKKFNVLIFIFLFLSIYYSNGEIYKLLNKNTLNEKINIKSYLDSKNLNDKLEKKCSDEINGIDRFTLNPICQDINYSMNNYLGNDFSRHIYIYKKQLPQFVPSSKNFDVADGSLYTYAGSPITPNQISRDLLQSIYGSPEQPNTINYFFEVQKLYDQKFRNLLKNLNIQYLVIENDLITNDFFEKTQNSYKLVAKNSNLSIFDTIGTNKLFQLYEVVKEDEILNDNDRSKNYLSPLEPLISPSYNIFHKALLKNINSNLKINGVLGSISSFAVNCPSKCIMIIGNVYLNGYKAFGSGEEFTILRLESGKMGILFEKKYSGNIFLEFSDFYKNIGTLIFLIILNILAIIFTNKVLMHKKKLT
jgi:hypothetical protein